MERRGAHHGGERHGHEHGHLHHREVGERRLTGVLVLTGTFTIVEFLGGLFARSLALMADAAHMLADVAALSLALFALRFARRPATARKSYGYFRLEILAALLNGIVLIALSALIFYEAIRRFGAPEPIEGALMLSVASAGLLANLVSARILHRSAAHNLNVRGAYLHVLGDLLGSVGAIVAALLILTTGWVQADPLISLVVGLLILISSWRLVREAVDILLEAVPPHIDPDAVREAIAAVAGVHEVHDLHVWTVSSGYLAMSAHAVAPDPHEHQRILEEVHERMREEFAIHHVTLQLERESLARREEHPF
jgi:cobalt-zinc-cadmium efflux system protein